MPQTTNYGFPLLSDTPPEGMTGKDLRDLILGESETSLSQMMDAALKNVEGKIPESQVQADWSQTDDTQPDYIKNKPSIPQLPKYAKVASSGNYNDLGCKPFGDFTILPQKKIYFTKGGLNIDGLCINTTVEGEGNIPMQAQDAIVPGEQYVVIWDGTEYTLTAGNVDEFADGFDGVTYVGNQARFFGGITGSSTDSGEPFIVLSQNGTTIVIHTDTLGWHTVSVTPVNTVRRIESKYLPEGLATENYVVKNLDAQKDEIARYKDEMARQLAAILPAFTSADEGKVLGVKNGKLAWVKVQTEQADEPAGMDVTVDGNALVLGDGAYVDGNVLVLGDGVSVEGNTLVFSGKTEEPDAAEVSGSVLAFSDDTTVDGNTLALDSDASVDGTTLILGG